MRYLLFFILCFSGFCFGDTPTPDEVKNASSAVKQMLDHDLEKSKEIIILLKGLEKNENTAAVRAYFLNKLTDSKRVAEYSNKGPYPLTPDAEASANLLNSTITDFLNEYGKEP